MLFKFEITISHSASSVATDRCLAVCRSGLSSDSFSQCMATLVVSDTTKHYAQQGFIFFANVVFLAAAEEKAEVLCVDDAYSHLSSPTPYRRNREGRHRDWHLLELRGRNAG